jgi:hypothetical protein
LLIKSLKKHFWIGNGVPQELLTGRDTSVAEGKQGMFVSLGSIGVINHIILGRTCLQEEKGESLVEGFSNSFYWWGGARFSHERKRCEASEVSSTKVLPNT